MDHHHRVGRVRGQDDNGNRDDRELGVYGCVADGVCDARADAERVGGGCRYVN